MKPAFKRKPDEFRKLETEKEGVKVYQGVDYGYDGSETTIESELNLSNGEITIIKIIKPNE